MRQDQWAAVDHYITDMLLAPDPVFESVLEANAVAGLPSIDVAPNQGKFLNLLARLAGARRILEIGTLGGYSTIWLARALPAGGRLVTLEADPKHAEVARANIARAGLADVVDIRVGPAMRTLPQLEEQGMKPFDLFFIEADKEHSLEYLQWALKLSRLGSLIICDNVVRGGRLIDATSPDRSVQGVRRFFELLSAEPRLSATALQTVGAKGYDGFAMAVVCH
jgi:predicted O-methyltransferase YrrM